MTFSLPLEASTLESLTRTLVHFLWQGTLLAAGAACRTSVECASGHWCEQTACPGVCRGKQPVDSVVGAPEGCSTASSEGLGDGGFRCREFSGLGERCQSTRLSCAPELACAADGGCVPLRLAARGEACSPSIACVGGLGCRSTDGGTEGICGARPAPGESCAADPVGCANNAVCRSEACVSLEAVGDPCVTTVDCTTGLACRVGRCGAKGITGSTCNAGLDCREELRCVKGKCLPPLCVR